MLVGAAIRSSQASRLGPCPLSVIAVRFSTVISLVSGTPSEQVRGMVRVTSIPRLVFR